MRPHGRAKVDRFNPSAFGICDSCGFLYNLKDLHFQKEWYGARIQNTNMLRCYHCLDRLQEQHRVIHLPADPVPVENPRVERESILNDPIGTIAITYGIGSQPVFGTMAQGAGLRSAFDANPVKPFALSAASYLSINGDNTIGRNWQGIAENNNGISINRFIAYAPNNARFYAGGTTPWRFEGSNDGMSFTVIASGATTGVIGEVIDVSFVSTFFMYHRFVLTGNGIHSVSVALLRLFKNPGTEPTVPSPIPPTPIILPTITSLSPNTGPVGSSVTISGSGFTGATAVNFGSASASFTVASDTTITTTASPGTGATSVTVTTPVGVSNSVTFTYTATLPSITSLSPNTGPIGTAVTISGVRFTGATSVNFGATSAPFTVVNDTTITTTVPSGTGVAFVTVTTPVGISNAVSFTYTAVAPTAPVLILVSATTTATFTIDVDNTIAAGDSVELQVQVTGGSWTTLVSDTVHTITSGEDAANQINLSLGLPNGSYDARALVTDTMGTGLSSPWSNTVVNFTISGAVAPGIYFLMVEGF